MRQPQKPNTLFRHTCFCQVWCSDCRFLPFSCSRPGPVFFPFSSPFLCHRHIFRILPVGLWPLPLSGGGPSIFRPGGLPGTWPVGILRRRRSLPGSGRTSCRTPSPASRVYFFLKAFSHGPRMRGSKKHVHSREASTGHYIRVSMRCLRLSTVTVLCSPMSHSRSTVRVTRTLDTPLGIASAAPVAAGILLLQPLPS